MPLPVADDKSPPKKKEMQVLNGALMAAWSSGRLLWDYWAHCGIFENGVLLMYTLEGVSSVANFITAYEESQ